MLLEFGKANWIDKARQQPDKVRQVFDKMKTDGVLSTVDAVRSKLDQPLPLGYCNAGVVVQTGTGIDNFAVGDRVASNGHHAGVVTVCQNLCARIPDEVDDETASFTVIGAIALQGVRLLQPTLGEAVAVVGLGLVGLMAVQLLRANGCRVLGIDFDPARCALAKQFGADVVSLADGEDPLAAANAFSRGRGVDGVLVAAATKSNDVMRQAATMCRKRGRIVLVGVVGLHLSRDDFFKKELTFQVSSSYGPGRYDQVYEEKGQDYPFGFVRWTAQRNFEAVLDLFASGKLNVKPFITHRFEISDAEKAYGMLNDKAALGVILNYPSPEAETRQATVKLQEGEGQTLASSVSTVPVVGFVGAGNYASRVLIPAFREEGVVLDTLVSSGGVSSVHHGKKTGFLYATTDADAVFEKPEVDTVVIATRHNQHARQVILGLRQGKNVFVEKPLALTLDDLDEIDKVYHAKLNDGDPPRLMIGFNRRFSPHVRKMKELLALRKEPLSIIITINAGAIPPDHWSQDLVVGGGRIIGEGCHFVDLARFLVDASIISCKAVMIGESPGVSVREDKACFILSFADGSIATIHYLANGGNSFPKERVEVFCGGGTLQLDNFRILRGFSWPGFKRMLLLRQDKGQQACVKAFVNSIQSGIPAPIPYDEIIETSRISIDLTTLLRRGEV
ncbi:MAG: bi-domain-containing oxidoreductase [Desulfobulbaceae bacterium]|nr:bi-domain-containing oxidoreductase [Desulfobulbaceae bacterium]